MQNIDKLKYLFIDSFNSIKENGIIQLPDGEIDPCLEIPRNKDNGDFSSTIALRLAKTAKKNPRDIANAIVDCFPENNIVEKFSVDGPGFINVFLKTSTIFDVVNTIRKQKYDFGKNCAKDKASDIEKKVNLEYISANPTGPMHVGHGRWAALGDSIAKIMRHAGYDVYEEFYVNDHGVQMNIFAKSIELRYFEQLGQSIDIPENFYGGEYVIEIAKEIVTVDGNKWEKVDSDVRLNKFKQIGQEKMMNQLKDTLDCFGTEFDLYFSESTLYDKDDSNKCLVDYAIDEFTNKNLLYKKDGAVWFKSTNFGDEKDRVIIKENGDVTYFLSDCAYHRNKLERGFDLLIDIWGADHHGYIPRMKAMMKAWDSKPENLEILLGQLVKLYRGKELVRMSKRKGDMITFQELIDEVGVDATRYLMLSKSSSQAIDFDIELAKKQDSSNPVYYVQYAHARICSILRKAYLNLGANGTSTTALFSGGLPAVGADEAKVEIMPIDDLVNSLISENIDFSILENSSEIELCKLLDAFVEVVYNAAVLRAPHKLVNYSQELAAAFHRFYTNCRVMDCNKKVRKARLALCDATRIILDLTLSLLGVSAPVKM